MGGGERGASLRPSPTISTLAPWAFSCFQPGDLVGRQRAGLPALDAGAAAAAAHASGRSPDRSSTARAGALERRDHLGRIGPQPILEARTR